MATDYLGGLGVLPDPLGAINKQIAFTAGLDAQRVNNDFKRAQIAAQSQKMQRQQQFATAMEGYLANPTAEGLASLMGQFPEYGEEAKAAFGALDEAKRKADLRQLGEITSLAAHGNYSKAAEVLRARIEADKAAGDEDPQDARTLEALESGDPLQQKQALGLLTYGIGIAVGPEHAKSFLEVQGLSQAPDLMSVAPGAEVIDEKTGRVVHSSPYKPSTITDPTTGQVFQLVPKGQGASGEPIAAPAVDFFSSLATTPGGEPGAPRDGGARAHAGRDFSGVNVGTAIPAPLGARLVDTGSDGKSGYWGKWQLSDGSTISIAHLQRPPTARDVRAGEPLGIAGNTGNASTSGSDRAVLHVRTWTPDGKEVDPKRVLAGATVQKVRSIQEAQALPKGTRFLDPTGVMRVR